MNIEKADWEGITFCVAITALFLLVCFSIKSCKEYNLAAGTGPIHFTEAKP